MGGRNERKGRLYFCWDSRIYGALNLLFRGEMGGKARKDEARKMPNKIFFERFDQPMKLN